MSYTCKKCCGVPNCTAWSVTYQCSALKASRVWLSDLFFSEQWRGRKQGSAEGVSGGAKKECKNVLSVITLPSWR